MIINNNIPALNTYRQMGINQGAAQKAMEKLSSGLRINRAGDDAAGLAISEKMRAQVRGLDQASRNAQDGISMIQTAEGALGETHNILQRMRELATQAANDTNVDVDRNEIQKEINELTSEINRIGNTTEFNTQKILKGSAESVETKPALTLEGLGDTVFPGGETTGGATIAATGASVTITASADVADNTDAESLVFNLQGKEITLTINTGGAAAPSLDADGNGATVNIATGTTANDMASALETALKAVIDANDEISAEDFTISVTGADLTVASNAKGAEQFVNIAASDPVLSTSGFDTGSDVSYTPSSVNVQLTDVADADALAALVGKGFTIGDKTVEFYNANEGIYEGSADFAVNISEVQAGVFGASAEGLATAIANQLSDKVEGVTITANGTGQLTFTSTADGAKGDGLVIKDGVDVAAVTSSEKFTATFQVGANQGQSMGIEINDMRSLALGVSGNDSGAVITGKDGKAIENAAFTKTTSVTDGTNNEKSEFALDVSTHEGAAAAVTVINNAIETVSAQRSNLGSFQNRLEHTISNLNNSSENLSAAESRIRDVDMAKEVMEMTRANILGQASQAMLAQANQAPQSVLQLLG